MEQAKPIFYNFWRSGSSFRVRIALNWKKIAYENVSINTTKEGGFKQHSEEYAKLNPYNKIPTLIIDG